MNADRLAHWYRWVERLAFGHQLEQARFAYLDQLAEARRVLVVGEGDGRALQRMLVIAPHAQFDVVETSGAMIELAHTRVPGCERVRFRHGDIRSIELPLATYDAVVTFFVLDCFTSAECEFVMKRLADSLAPGAEWLLSEFNVREHGWRRWHALAWISTMYFFFRVTTGLRVTALPQYETHFAAMGWSRTDFQYRRWGLILSAVYARAGRPPNDEFA